MHLMIPHVSAVGEASAHVLGELALPRLAELLGLLAPVGPALGGDEMSLNTPFELALAELRGCVAAPGSLPTAAWLAQGLADSGGPWALLTPIHLLVGGDKITALAPEALALTEAESRVFFASLGELWPADEDWRAHYLSATQWLVGHARFAGLATASLDRVVQRNVDAWMPEARSLRILQNEVQMLLHGQPLNEAREARGALALNSVWISGCGASSAVGERALPADLVIDDSLREPMLAGDWAAWSEAWVELDAGPLQQLLSAAKQAEPVRLTLCGERQAQTFTLPARSALQRIWHGLRQPRADAARVLGCL